MKEGYQGRTVDSKWLKLNLAILGGGETLKRYIDFFQKISPPRLAVKILGACHKDPHDKGLEHARNLGMFTTQNCGDLLGKKGLDGVLLLEDEPELLLELMRRKPGGVWVLDHRASRLFKALLAQIGDLGRKHEEVAAEKMISSFLFQQANERIVVLTPDFKILEASEGYLTAVNKAKDQVVGRHCYEITHGLNSPCSEWMQEKGCPLVETLRTGRSAHAIHEHLIDGERAIYCDLETYPVKSSENSQIIRVIEIWRDITNELSSRWEMRLSQLKTDMGKLVQEDRLISLGKLSASCVHEINNPIQGLLTFSHLMQSMLEKGRTTPPDLEDFKHYLNLMSTELERCGNIISGLLSFAREATMETRDVALKDVIQAVTSLVRHRMELQNIHATVELPEENLTVRGDVNQLQQCFLNLLFNAIEAMPEGGELRFAVQPDYPANEVLIVIQDSGCGISEKHMDKIFDPFFTTKEVGRGTGLGLSIVYGIIKKHEGRIVAESRKGEGAIFRIHLPLAVRQTGGANG